MTGCKGSESEIKQSRYRELCGCADISCPAVMRCCSAQIAPSESNGRSLKADQTKEDNKMKKKFAAAFLASLLLNLLLAAPIQANSAQRHWRGTDSTGALVKDKNCPLVVDKELLTFDVQEFPKNYYNSIEEFLTYTGKVTAEYTFRNPADYTVTATLVFPFGNLPHYGEYIYDSYTGKHTAAFETDKFGVAVNGKPINTTVRHTLKDRGTPFSLNADMPKLTDGYIADSFFRPDLPVWVQQYSVEGINPENQAATAAFVLREDLTKTRVLWEEKSGIATLKDGIRISGWIKTGDTLTVYIFGEPPKDGITWSLYENGACKKKTDGNITLKHSEQMTFRDFVFREYDNSSGISESDWYNAQVAFMNDGSKNWMYGGIYTEKSAFSLMRWYEYTMTLEPGQTLTNTVTAPLYPAIDAGYTPSIYTYTYLLSPAKTWAQFVELKIVVNTPYYMTENNQGGFLRTEKGYELTLPGLPEKELTFTLSESEHPRAPKLSLPFHPVFLLAGFAGFALIGGSVIAVVLIVKRKKSRGKEQS